MAKDHLLAVENVSKVYGDRRVVDQVSLHVDRGEIVALLGRNGAGKTTTFRMVIGLEKPSGGEILFRGEVVTQMPVDKRSRQGMGFLPQEPSALQGLTVEENLQAVLETAKEEVGTRRARAAQMLEEYGLIELATEKASTLSGALARRLEICRVMITNPSILILDEPFAGVDPIAVGELYGLIRRLRERGIAVLLGDHNVREILKLCDRAYVLNEGRVLREGSQGELLSSN